MPLTIRLPERVWASARGRLVEFLSWWRDELRTAADDWALQRLVRAGGRGLAQIENGELVLVRVLPDGKQTLGSVLAPQEVSALPASLRQLLQGRRNLPAELDVILPAEAVLTRELNLPAAVGRNFRQAAAYQLERLMPLRAELVYHDCAVVAHDEARLRLALSVARRELVDGVAGVALDAGVRRVGLLGPAGVGQARFSRRSMAPEASSYARLDRRLAAAAAVLALSLTTVLGVQYHLENRRLAAQVADLKLRATAAEKLRDELDVRMVRMRFLADHFARPGAGEVLAELTRLIPQDAWLFQFQSEGSRISIAGYGSDASAVTAALGGSVLLKDAALRSAVKSPGGDGERFDLALLLKEATP